MQYRYKFFYKYQAISFRNDFVDRLESVKTGLTNDLQNIILPALNINSNIYLKTLLQEIEFHLAYHTYIIGSTLIESTRPLQSIVFIEYGGGFGFQSLLARRLGVGTVIYNDILHDMCTMAEEIARTIGSQADYYVEGDIDDLVQFCDRHRIKADAVSSMNVLEHIYDIDDFCRKLSLISHEGTTMMHASGSNIFWYPYVASVTKQHMKVETRVAEEADLSTYFKEREKIIREHALNLNEEEIKKLAANTRGLIRDDIVRTVNRYIENGEFPKLIEHPSNTCNPYTGSWAEHSMNPYYLQETLSFNGFDAIILPGSWPRGNSFIKNIIHSILNALIHMSSPYVGLHFSLYFSIYAKYNGQFSDEINKQHKYRCHHSPAKYLVLLPYIILSHLRHQRGFVPWSEP